MPMHACLCMWWYVRLCFACVVLIGAGGFVFLHAVRDNQRAVHDGMRDAGLGCGCDVCDAWIGFEKWQKIQ